MAMQKVSFKQAFAFPLVFLLIFSFDMQLFAQHEPNRPKDFFEMSIEELMNVEVTSASKKAESLYEAPGVMVVVPREEIEAYGDRDLHQLLQRQPSIYTRDVFRIYG